MKDRTLMMAAMSHDLRIPLTRLRLRIEMAEGLEDQQKMLDELDTLVDLSALVEGSCEDAVDAGERAAFSGPRDVTISCRPTAMRRAISNLVDNAVKHGGATEIRLAAISSVDGVEITVDDNGLGVPEEERAAVFDRFSRGSTASRSGSGLGLALVAQQAEIHGGTAALQTSPMGGARLLLRLPPPT